MCNGSGRWIPLEAVSPLVGSALRRAGVSKAIASRVAPEIAREDVAQGIVTLVETGPAKRRVKVETGTQGGGSIETFFEFPPNTPNIEAELIRAQDMGRYVSVCFIPDSTGKNLIDLVLVWAGGFERY
jgi:hypothetical protein